MVRGCRIRQLCFELFETPFLMLALNCREPHSGVKAAMLSRTKGSQPLQSAKAIQTNGEHARQLSAHFCHCDQDLHAGLHAGLCAPAIVYVSDYNGL